MIKYIYISKKYKSARPTPPTWIMFNESRFDKDKCAVFPCFQFDSGVYK